MKDYRAAMLQSLVAVAWADDKLHARELEVIEALIAAFGLDPAEAEAIREYAKTPRSLDDIPLSELSLDDRRVLVLHAVMLSYAEYDPSAAELALISQLIERLHIPADEADDLLATGHARAKQLGALRERSREQGA